MLEIMYIPTGNVFTVPDTEALELVKRERWNYKIINAGLQEEKEPEKVSEEDISKIVLKSEERAKEIEAEDKAEEDAKKEFEIEGKEYKTELNFDKFTKPDLVGALRRVGIKCNTNHYSKPQLVEMAIKAGIKP